MCRLGRWSSSRRRSQRRWRTDLCLRMQGLWKGRVFVSSVILLVCLSFGTESLMGLGLSSSEMNDLVGCTSDFFLTDLIINSFLSALVGDYSLLGLCSILIFFFGASTTVLRGLWSLILFFTAGYCFTRFKLDCNFGTDTELTGYLIYKISTDWVSDLDCSLVKGFSHFFLVYRELVSVTFVLGLKLWAGIFSGVLITLVIFGWSFAMKKLLLLSARSTAFLIGD